MTNAQIFLGLVEAFMAQGEQTQLSFRCLSKERIVLGFPHDGASTIYGQDSDLMGALGMALSSGKWLRKLVPPSDIEPKAAVASFAHITGWLDAHPTGEVNVSRVGSDRLVVLKTGTADGNFFGQDGSLVRAVAEAAEVARLREHSN